jgi:hypothetical protein
MVAIIQKSAEITTSIINTKLDISMIQQQRALHKTTKLSYIVGILADWWLHGLAVPPLLVVAVGLVVIIGVDK